MTMPTPLRLARRVVAPLKTRPSGIKMAQRNAKTPMADTKPANATTPPAAPEPPPAIDTLRVVPHDKGWALRVDDLSEPAWVVSTKKRAVTVARQAARFHEATLQVLTRAGKVQKTYDFAAA